MTSLLLGPIVGHTDSTGSRVWIRVEHEIDGWILEVAGQRAPFQLTDPVNNEFGTAIASVSDLEPNTFYDYHVLLNDEQMAAGSFRTMPLEGSHEDVTFVSLSCNDDQGVGAWRQLTSFIEVERPRFLLMLGDQVYLDHKDDDLWRRHLASPSDLRRRALAQKYQSAWSKSHVAWVLANTPTYMTWDDHDIRDGWGSWASDSATLAAQFPAGRPIFEKNRAFFNDARNVYYHFQACLNPDSARLLDGVAAPFTFRCGRLLVVVLDERTQRDFARPANPVLGDEQWQFIRHSVERLDENVDAIAVANGIPLVDLNPDGKTHRLFRGRRDDIKPFSRGDEQALENKRVKVTNRLLTAATVALGTTVDRGFRVARLLGVGAEELDDVRDRWSYATNRPEQLRLLRLFADAATQGRSGMDPRGLVFLGGDIHVGALFDIAFANAPLAAQCLITSGISQVVPPEIEVKGGVLDVNFLVADDIQADRTHLVMEPNFGITLVRFSEASSGAITNGFGHASADS